MTNAPDFVPSPRLYPFTSRWLDTSHGRVHYVDEGTGRPLLLLHGNPTWSFLYRAVIRALRDRFRCIAIDYLGFGLSERPAGFGYTPAEHAAVVGELMRRLDLHDLVVMGHDWGGPTGLSAAADHPERVSGLVLGNTAFWPPDRAGRLVSLLFSTWLMQRRITHHNFFVEHLLFPNVVRALGAEEKEHYRKAQPTPGLRVAVAKGPRQIAAAAPWLAELEGRVQRHLAHKPVLATYPMADRAFPAKTTCPGSVPPSTT